MNKLLLILLCLPMVGFGQLTYVPDSTFEDYLETHSYDGVLVSIGSPLSMGNGTPNDHYVFTANIDTITNLEIKLSTIADLTGIEDFTDLIYLNCRHNLLTTIDVSQNTALTDLRCQDNLLTTLDVSNNTYLEGLYCSDNQIISLDVRNGNNTNFTFFWATNNPNLYCIDVDDVAWATANWTASNFPQSIDVTMSFGVNCNPSSIQEHTINKELLKVTDLLGRETKGKRNQILFYIYDDGTVEKRIIFE